MSSVSVLQNGEKCYSPHDRGPRDGLMVLLDYSLQTTWEIGLQVLSMQKYGK